MREVTINVPACLRGIAVVPSSVLRKWLTRAMVSAVCDVEIEQWFRADRV